MTSAATAPSTPARTQRRPVSRALILVVGVIVVPMALAVLLNSWGPLTEESALRMAGGSVAGQTVAIISAITALVLTVRRRYALPAIIAFVVIATLVSGAAIGNMITAGEVLLDRLDLVRSVSQLGG